MKQYDVQAFDGMVPEDLRARVWEYIQQQEFHATRKDVNYPTPGSIIYYKPVDGKQEWLDDSIPSVNDQYIHRCVFGADEEDLYHNHPVIGELWNTINNYFNNQFVIAGDPEGIALMPPRVARVYVNAQPQENIKRTHGIHRDTIDLNEETHFTLMFIANPEWYPTWMAENIFYSDDDTTEDTQQFQKGFGQSRGFNVGYPHSIVSPVSGRVIIYDGRNLHTTKPAAVWAKEMRKAVIFRIKRVM
jgi:hypothetical protein